MPDINVRGRYRAFTYDGTTSFDFTTYANNVSVIRRPNEISFVTLRQYIPGISTPFTTFEPGSSYVVVSRNSDANFDMGPYTRVDRLPSSLNVRSPQYYLGLDKNSITIPLSVYALSVNNPLSSVTGITYINGVGASQSTVTTDQIRNGFQTSFTHFLPNSGYQLRNRVPYTFFAPLQSEMGDAWATGYNVNGQLGMGYQYNSFGYTQLYGNWDKVVTSITHAAALSTCGTKKKLFVCGGNAYGQLGLTPVANGTLQPSVTATQTVWIELKNIWTWVWDEFGETYYYRNVLDSEDILDVEVGASFTLIKTNVQLYGCGRMCHLGIVPPGRQVSSDYQFNDVGGTSITNYYVPYFTSFLNRSTSILFNSTNGADSALYYQIPSNNINKFQARDARWYWLDAAGRLYGTGKIAGGATTDPGAIGSSSPVVLPIGLTLTSTTSYTTPRQLVGPGAPVTRYDEQFFNDFDASKTNIVALSADNKSWVLGGAMTFLANNPSLSTICFFDPVQNAYVPQKDYFLRLVATQYGCMGNLNGKLYFSGFTTYNGAGTDVSSRLPATTLPKLNGALGANPEERTRHRTLIPLTYMGRPDINWKSLFTSTFIIAAVDSSNKLYICGDDGLGRLGHTGTINTLTQPIPDNIYNVNVYDNNLLVYKTNRNPAPSPTPIPSPTPTPTATPAVVYPQANGARIMISCTNPNAEYAYNGHGSYICLMDSDDCDNWVCRNTAFDNRTSGTRQVGLFYNFNPSPGRSIIAETLYMMWPSWGACIPTNLPGNPYKTLLVFQSSFTTSTSPNIRTGYLNIGKSVNNTISQNPAGSSAVTWTRYINPLTCLQVNETPIEPRFGCSSEGLNLGGNAGFTNTDCFWDPNNSAGPRMYVVFSRLGNFTNNLNGHIIDPINPIYSNNSISIIPEQTIQVLPAPTPASERICRSASNGYMYCAVYLVAGGGKILRIVYYDRNKINVYPSGWNALPDVPNIPGPSIDTPVSPGIYYGKAKIIRVSFFNNGDAVLCYVLPRDQISSNSNFRVSNPYSDLYMQFYRKNTNSWTTPTIIKGNLIVRGIWTVASDNNPNAWMQPSTFAPYDITVNPLTQQIHLIFNQDTGSIACNQRIYFAKFNQQGTQIGSDTEVFNPATAYGQTYGFAGDIELFHKSTNANEFIPYFKTQHNASTGLYPGTPSRVNANTSVFKFNGTTYVKIFTPSVPATGSYVGFYKSSGTATTSRDSWGWSAQHKVFQ